MLDAQRAERDDGGDRNRKPAAERIRESAKDLFHRHGIRATGIEEVVRAAGTTKMSLYRAFPSKDALVASILEEDRAEFEEWFRGIIAGKETPAARLLALVEAFASELECTDRCGCPLLLAQAEFREPGHPTHREVERLKQRQRQLVTEAAAGAADPEALGDAISLVIDGAWVNLPFLGGARTAQILRAAARGLIAAEFPAAVSA